MNNDKLKEYFLQEISEEERESIDYSSWRVLSFLRDDTDRSFHIYKSVLLKTDSKAWPEEFMILATPMDSNVLILVSPECPEVYFIMKDEILDKIKDILEFHIQTEEDLRELIENGWKKYFSPNQNQLNYPYQGGIGQGYLGINWVGDPINSILHTSTLKAVDYKQQLQQPLNANFNIGDIVYCRETSSMYVYDGNDLTDIVNNTTII